jgi:hypothetical protein
MLAQTLQGFARDAVNEFQSRLESEQVRARAPEQANVNAVVVRVSMIEHHDGSSAGAQHAMNFAHRTHSVRRVMQYAVRINEVERVVREV